MIKTYRKKPVEIQAVQFTGSMESALFIMDWAAPGDVVIEMTLGQEKNILRIPTLEGTMEATPEDYVIKGIQGEFYPCKPDIFEESYEQV